MERSSDRVTVNVRKTPFLFSRKSLYQLSDFSYCEWLVFEKDKPRYYLNVFDEQYSQIRDQFKSDAEKYLQDMFKTKGLDLSLKENSFGIPLSSKSEIVALNLERLPLEIIS